MAYGWFVRPFFHSFRGFDFVKAFSMLEASSRSRKALRVPLLVPFGTGFEPLIHLLFFECGVEGRG